MKKYKSKFLILLKLAISISILGVLIKQTGTRELWVELQRVSPFYIILVLITSTLRQFVGGWRWKYVLSHAGNIRVTLFTTTKLYFAAIFVSNFLPGANTGDIIRPMGLKNLGAGRQKFAYATVIYERFLGLLSVTLLAIIGAIFFAAKHNFLYLFIVIGIVITFGLTIFIYYRVRPLKTFQRGFLEKFFNIINDIFDQIGCMLRQREMTVIVLLMSFIFNIMAIVIYWVNSIALHADVSFLIFFLAAPLGWIAAMIPVSFNGLGLREGLMCFILKDFGVPLETSLAIVLLFLPVQIFCSIIGAWFFVTMRLKIK